MDRLDAGVEAELLGLVDRLLRGADPFCLSDEFRELRILFCRGGRERMIRGESHEFRAKQRVRARRENLKLAFRVRRRFRIQCKANEQAFRAADPVALHQPHLVRPALERVDGVKQILRIIADLEEPLRQLALLDECAGAPAASVDHLLVGEHGLIDRIPVHLRLLALDQTRLEEVEKHLLLVLVIGRIAGREFARPVERQPHRLELRLHGGDVFVGPGFRMHLARHGGVLRRHAERVPAHRMQHLEAHRTFVARNHVTHGVVAHVTHMDAPGRIREHLQHVIFRARVGIGRGENALLVPHLAPAGLGLAAVVTLGRHRLRSFICGFERPRKDTKFTVRSTVWNLVGAGTSRRFSRFIR